MINLFNSDFLIARVTLCKSICQAVSTQHQVLGSIIPRLFFKVLASPSSTTGSYSGNFQVYYTVHREEKGKHLSLSSISHHNSLGTEVMMEAHKFLS